MQYLIALGVGGSATLAMNCHSAWGQQAVQLLEFTASIRRGSGPFNSCNALPHCLWAVGRATPTGHRHTDLGQWAVQLLECTAVPGASGPCNSLQCTPSLPGGIAQCNSYTTTLPRGSGQCNSCNALPHFVGAVGSATLAMHRLTAGTGR